MAGLFCIYMRIYMIYIYIYTSSKEKSGVYRVVYINFCEICHAPWGLVHPPREQRDNRERVRESEMERAG